ncbi:membrane protein [Wenjunlia tyrosinilytica]|uniref:Membrane protein n=1 Tax=Wenjunlia tyrosinilytica TaxID=1544741 RepID=A0A917ZF29_9ACTN|nr:membrane protein [Wenjunlia tyrosinilytica]
MGLLLAALPLVCAAVLYRTRYRVAGSRRLAPSRVPAMSEARVHLRVDNVSRMPTGLLMLQDRVPYVLGPRPRFVLDRVEPGGHREVSYRVRSDLRGKYPLGPLQLRLTDPFGMCELTRSFSAFDTLTVVPTVHPLAPVRLVGESTGYGDSRTRAVALAGEDDVIPRGYRHGDDLRRVHWRSTARYGELMVRREEQPQRARCTVLLDTRRQAHRGTGPDSTFEWAVSGAASAAVHLLERGYGVRLLTDSGSCVPGVDGVGGAGYGSASDTAGVLLDTLAVVDHSDGAGFSRAHDVLRGGSEGLLVAFVGALDEEQASVLARTRQRVGGAVVFLLDTGVWGGPAPAAASGATASAMAVSGMTAPGATAFGTAASGTAASGGSAGEDPLTARERTLREAGWSVHRVVPGATLPKLWQRADRYSTDDGGPVAAGGGMFR